MNPFSQVRLWLVVIAFALVAWSPVMAQDGTDTATDERRVEVHVFGDVDFLREPDDTSNAFAFGQLDLFATASLSDRLHALVEIIAEPGDDNALAIDLERLTLEYQANDYFHIGAGRYHTAIGYFNTAYHHGTWFQTAPNRPLVFAFEDDGGLLPIHGVGLTMSGRVPWREAGIAWTAQIGNGRAPEDGEPVQIRRDVDTHKAVTLAVVSRPTRVAGLEIGGSFYVDRFDHTATSRVDERIASLYAVFLRGGFEWLNEAVQIRHAAEQDAWQTTRTYYTQVGHRVGTLTPYARYQFLDVAGRDPLYREPGRLDLTSLGVRYDLAPSAAFKLQVDRQTRDRDTSTGFATQVAFFF